MRVENCASPEFHSIAQNHIQINPNSRKNFSQLQRIRSYLVQKSRGSAGNVVNRLEPQ